MTVWMGLLVLLGWCVASVGTVALWNGARRLVERRPPAPSRAPTR